MVINDHEISFRLLKSFRMPFLANIFWFIYDLNTISIYEFFMGSNCGYDFFMVWICFFYGFGYDFLMIFLMVFLVLRIWFSSKNSRNFRFFLILLEFL